MREPGNLPGQVHDLELTGDRNRVDIRDLGAAQLVGGHGVRSRPKRLPRVVENLAGDPIAVPRPSLRTLRGPFTDPGGDCGKRAHAGKRRAPGSRQPAALKRPLQPRSVAFMPTPLSERPKLLRAPGFLVVAPA